MNLKLNGTEQKAVEVSKAIKKVFADEISATQIYDVVHEPNHYEFKIQFVAYNYFSVIFQYELDIIDCAIVCGDKTLISIVDGHYCFSDCDLDNYFQKVKANLRLRIPDKFLVANGWL